MSQKKEKLQRRMAKKMLEPYIQQEISNRRKEWNRKFAKGGLEKEKVSRKDYIRERVFGGSPVAFVAGERLRRIKESGILGNVIYQGSENSCVSCSFTWTNMYNSYFRSSNKIALNWRSLWDLVPKYEGGSKPRDNGDVLRKNGQSEVGKENPEKYKINNYLYLGDKSYKNIVETLKDTPVIIGVYSDEAGLSFNKFGHAIVCVDLDENGNYVCINWWNAESQDIVTIPKETKLLTALTLEDLPDEVKPSEVRRGWWGALNHWL